VVVKTRLYKSLPILKALYQIVNRIADLGCKHDAEINCNCKSLLQLLNRAAFAIVSIKITHYALEMAMRKWSVTKVLRNSIEARDLLDFELGTECITACQLLVWFGLPYKH
jgi:hypothetical protein